MQEAQRRPTIWPTSKTLIVLYWQVTLSMLICFVNILSMRVNSVSPFYFQVVYVFSLAVWFKYPFLFFRSDQACISRATYIDCDRTWVCAAICSWVLCSRPDLGQSNEVIKVRCLELSVSDRDDGFKSEEHFCIPRKDQANSSIHRKGLL